MNVTLNKNLGLDTSVLKEVSAEILKRAQAKTAQNVQSGAYQAVDLGVDLYNGKVDTQIARQISMNNSGLQIQLNQDVLNSIKYLNTQAAQNVQKNIEGKIAFSVYEGADVQKAPETPKFNSIVSFAASKDKQNSSSYYHGELLANFNKKEDEEINIFA